MTVHPKPAASAAARAWWRALLSSAGTIIASGGLAVTLMVACATKPSSDTATASVPEARTAMSQQPNTLSDAERREGWRLLFDGTNLNAWREYKGDAIAPAWRVVDGNIVKNVPTEDIVTREQFGDFELAFDWKIAPKGNSGVMYRVTEDGDETYWSGPEYQVLDNSRGERSLEQAGSLYALYAPVGAVTKPVGEYNQGRIVIRKGHVEHWLNGVKVVAYQLGSDDFKARVAGSKFKAWPMFAKGAKGHIALQNHGDAVAYRNIKIRRLD